MRFSLNQIEVFNLPDNRNRKTNVNVPESHVTGIYVNCQLGKDGTHASVTREERKILFWFYGGAFFAGDCEGNVGLAERIAVAANCDIFLCSYRRCPEVQIQEAKVDAFLGYQWFVNSSGYVFDNDASRSVSVLGISSGKKILMLTFIRISHFCNAVRCLIAYS